MWGSKADVGDPLRSAVVGLTRVMGLVGLVGGGLIVKRRRPLRREVVGALVMVLGFGVFLTAGERQRAMEWQTLPGSWIAAIYLTCTHFPLTVNLAQTAHTLKSVATQSTSCSTPHTQPTRTSGTLTHPALPSPPFRPNPLTSPSSSLKRSPSSSCPSSPPSSNSPHPTSSPHPPSARRTCTSTS